MVMNLEVAAISYRHPVLDGGNPVLQVHVLIQE